MVVRKVQLAQAVCAVYSLSKPQGATKAEIAKFCRKRFGVVCTSRACERLLERAVDEGLLAKFRRRYRLARGSCCILWANRRGEPPHRGVKQGRRKRASRPALKRRSSVYRLWRRERRRNEAMRTKQNGRSVRVPNGARNNKRKTSIKKSRRHNKSEREKNKYSGPTTSKRTCSLDAIHRHRYNLRSRLPNERLKYLKAREVRPRGPKDRLKHPKNRTKHHNARPKLRKCTGLHNHLGPKYSKSQHVRKTRRVHSNLQTVSSQVPREAMSKKEKAERGEFYRSILRQTRIAVAHAKSWDRLNHSRQKGQRENAELVKDCRLVHRILTRPHAASWDNFNHKLRRMKEVRSGQELGAGAAPSRKPRNSWSKI